MLKLGIMLIEHDDEMNEFVVTYISHYNNLMKEKYNSYKRYVGCTYVDYGTISMLHFFNLFIFIIDH